MASFETHVRVGTGVHFALTTASLASPALGGPALIVLVTTLSLPLTVAGAVFPDIDHHASKPYRLTKRWAPRCCAGVVGVVLAANTAPLQRAVGRFVSPPRAQFYAGCLYCLLLWSVQTGVRRAIPICRPPHRTVTHAVSTGVVVSGFVAGGGVLLARTLVPGTPALVGSIWGLCFFSGLLSHRYCDGLGPIPKRRASDET